MEQRFTGVRLPRLAQAQLALQRATPRLASLPHVADLVSSYLDVSLLFTPPEAVTNYSTRLLDRVLTRVMNDPAVDDAFRSHWLARAFEVAIQKNSLANVQRIHEANPGPLHVRSLQLALQHGTLEMVLWIVENRNDRRCSAPGLQNLCTGCLKTALPDSIADHDAEAIVKWLVSVGANLTSRSSRRGLDRNIKIARWLDESHQPNIGNLVAGIISSGSRDAGDTLRYMIARGHTISDQDVVDALVQGACRRENESLIDIAVDSQLCNSIRDKFVWAPTRAGGAKVLQWDAGFMADAFVYGTIPIAQHVALYASQFCHVDTVKWLWLDRGYVATDVPNRTPPTEKDLLDLYQWMYDTGVDGWGSDDTECAARNGYLATIQWLHEHKPDQLTVCTVDTAASRGHLEIVKWLQAHGSVACSAAAFHFAAQNGHLEMVRWLSDNGVESATNDAMVMAAARGQLEVIAWLHANCDDACGVCVLRSVLYSMVPRVRGHPNSPEPNAIRWLAIHGTRSATCVDLCTPGPQAHGHFLPSAAALALHHGDLAVARYLWDHHCASCSVEPVALVVRGGHLPAIQWLHATAPDLVDWQVVLESARASGKEQIVAWIESMVVGGLPDHVTRRTRTASG